MKKKSQLVAIILSFCFGGFGLDRFYLGYKGIGFFKLFTIGGLGLLWLYDFKRICKGDLQPKDGEYDKTRYYHVNIDFK